ncbi:MAG: ABC transporter permease [Trueperaceae bacterium]
MIARGDESDLSVSQRLVPLLVLLTLLLAAVFVTSFGIVEERERGTLSAMLVTPTTLGEVLAAKGALGLVLAIAMAVVTLALNDALSARPLALLAGLLLGAVMSVQIGLIYGTLASDAKTLYTLVKSLNLLLVGPVVFYLFPDWPQWIAKLFPTYWFLDPIFEVAVQGADLAQVSGDLLVGAGICLALVPLIAWLARRAETRVAAG